MVDRPARLTSSGISVTRGRSRFQEGRFQGQVFHMTQEDVGVMPDVAGTIQLNTMQVYTLIDSGASRSFVLCRIVERLHVVPHKLRIRVTISTPLGENTNIDDIYRRVKLYIGGLESSVDLMPL